MPRTQLVYNASQFPTELDTSAKEDADAFFRHMVSFGGKEEIPESAGSFAIVARNPKLGLLLVKASDYMTRECPWTTQRNDLRQLMIQTINWHFKCDFNFQAHLASAERQGITAEMQAAIPYWKTTRIFNDEQRALIAYTVASLESRVTDEVYDDLVETFGDQSALEINIAIAWWSFWAILANAIGPEFDFGFSAASA